MATRSVRACAPALGFAALVFAFAALTGGPAAAHTISRDDRYFVAWASASDVLQNVSKQRSFKAQHSKRRHLKALRHRKVEHRTSIAYGFQREVAFAAGLPHDFVGRGQVVGGRPSGCPYRFCGCGASLHVFGRIIPALNLAANWLRFPRTAPAPKMVAARRGHVFVLERHVAGNMWIVFDANSGGHRTRIHPRSIAGYAIVNPRRVL